MTTSKLSRSKSSVCSHTVQRSAGALERIHSLLHTVASTVRKDRGRTWTRTRDLLHVRQTPGGTQAIPSHLSPETSGVSTWSDGAGMGRGGILVRYTHGTHLPGPATRNASTSEAWPPSPATGDLAWGEGRCYPRSVNRRQERPMRAR